MLSSHPVFFSSTIDIIQFCSVINPIIFAAESSESLMKVRVIKKPPLYYLLFYNFVIIIMNGDVFAEN